MEINLISTAYLPGVLQGIILLVVTNLRATRRRPSNLLLSALLFSITFLLVHHGLLLNEVRIPIPKVGDLAAAFWFSISPFLYLYIKSLLHPEFRFKGKYLFLFTIPLYNFAQWILHVLGFRMGFYLLFDSYDSYVYAWIFNYLLVSTVFSLASLSDLRQADLLPKHRKRIQWLKWYLYAFLGVLFGSVALLLFFISVEQYTDDYEYSLLIVYEVFVFVLVFKSIYFSPYIPAIANDQYRQAPVRGPDLHSRAAELQAFMDRERPWLDKGLGLKSLSTASGIPENTLSQIFSRQLKTNFYDFVNSYRLVELERMILDPANRQYKIASLADECGFSSKTSFYKAFKQKHQMTPTEFVKQQGLA